MITQNMASQEFDRDPIYNADPLNATEITLDLALLKLEETAGMISRRIFPYTEGVESRDGGKPTSSIQRSISRVEIVDGLLRATLRELDRIES